MSGIQQGRSIQVMMTFLKIQLYLGKASSGGSDGEECLQCETWILCLGREDPLEEGYVYPLQESCLENAMARGS